MNSSALLAAFGLALAACQPAPTPAAPDASTTPSQDTPAAIQPPAATAPSMSPHQDARLGVAFQIPDGATVSACEGDCLEVRSGPGDEGLLVTVQIFDQPLETVATDEAGFKPDAAGRLMTTYGRFTPQPVEDFQVNGLRGQRATVVCGVSDELGFHAAAGECLYAVLSDGQRSALITTSGFARPLQVAEALIPTFRFTAPR